MEFLCGVSALHATRHAADERLIAHEIAGQRKARARHGVK